MEKNGEDLIYAQTTWKKKSKKKDESFADMNPSGGSYLEEMKCAVGGKSFMSNALEMRSLCEEMTTTNARKEVDCEYAQVKFKNKPAELIKQAQSNNELENSV